MAVQIECQYEGDLHWSSGEVKILCVGMFDVSGSGDLALCIDGCFHYLRYRKPCFQHMFFR